MDRNEQDFRRDEAVDRDPAQREAQGQPESNAQQNAAGAQQNAETPQQTPGPQQGAAGPQQTPGAQQNAAGPQQGGRPYTPPQNPNFYGNPHYANPTPGGAPVPPYGQGANPNPNPAPNPNVWYSAPQKKAVHPNEAKHGRRGAKIFGAVVAVVMVAAIAVGAVALVRSRAPKAETTPDTSVAEIHESPTAASTGADGELTAKGVYEKVQKSSVGILVYASSAFSNEALAGQGSGVIVGEDSTGTYTYIVTCAHVISDGQTVKVQLYDETQYDATVVGYDSKTDIGVLSIRASGLTAMEFGDSDSLSVGETVYAIGNPGGVAFANSFTNGMVSAISRPVESDIGYERLCIQHTAAINPGNSGGALVNAYGQLVGINSSKIASTNYEGMGFAVPSVTVKDVFDDLVAHGYVTNRPKLGINYFPASSNQLYSMLVGANDLPDGTLVIQSITADSELNGTDAQPGDMIIRVNGEDLTSTDLLADLIEESNVGDTLRLTLCRVDAADNYAIHTFEVSVKLVEDRGDTASAEPTSQSYYNPFGAYGYGS